MNWLKFWAAIRRWWRRVASLLLAGVLLYGAVLAVGRLWPTGSLTLSWGGGPTLQSPAAPQAQPPVPLPRVENAENGEPLARRPRQRIRFLTEEADLPRLGDRYFNEVRAGLAPADQ
jgi:hypothetical protein